LPAYGVAQLLKNALLVGRGSKDSIVTKIQEDPIKFYVWAILMNFMEVSFIAFIDFGTFEEYEACVAFSHLKLRLLSWRLASAAKNVDEC